jgi:hypothetical protein
VRTQPILFSPTNPSKLYFASNVVWETVNGGQSWKAISPDLARSTWEVPKNVGSWIGTPEAKPTKRGVVYALAPSPVDSATIWAGTDDGLIHVTRNNGKAWTDVTPKAVGPWAKVSVMDASHFDANEAYAAVNTIRLDDQRPHIFRTKDGGKTWTEIVSGIAGDATINVVREDPRRRGLLFAGSETQVWFSLDDGDHWQSLRLNMPAQSIRDLIIKDADVAVATHGRGFWILDDISALRQWPAKGKPAPVVLFKPALATRVRYSMYTDSPVPKDEPMAENPPDGAVIDFWLADDAKGPVTLDIVNAAGRVVRHYASTDQFEAPHDVGNWPWYWFRPLKPLGAKAGLNRYVWDLHFAPPPAPSYSLPISATPYNTLRVPEGPWAYPGKYTVKLTVGAKTFTQVLMVRMDPRVKTPGPALSQQYSLSVGLYDAIVESQAMSEKIATAKKGAADSVAKALTALDSALTANRAQMLTVMDVLEGADVVPTSQAVTAATESRTVYAELVKRWAGMRVQ